MYILYENIMGKSLSFENMNSYTSLIVMFYAAIIATIQKNHVDLVITYDEFMDWLDSQQSAADTVKEFGDWLAANLNVNTSLVGDNDDVKENKNDKRRKSKN